MTNLITWPSADGLHLRDSGEGGLFAYLYVPIGAHRN